MVMSNLSKITGLTLAALTFWVIVTRPEAPVESEFLVPIYGLVALATAVVFGLMFLVMRIATAGSTTYWSGESQPKQLWLITLMIGVAIGLQLVAGRILDDLDRQSAVTFAVTGLVIWTLVPAIFLKFGIVKWPVRLRSISKPKMILATVICLCIAAASTYAVLSAAPPAAKTPSIIGLFVPIAYLIVAAAAEEVVFRVLFLTALLDLAVSRFQAVFLSSVAFAMVHVPLALAQPVTSGDWSLLEYAANAYAPEFLWQVAFGLLFGVIWLRTGSITLVVLTHALTNLGETLAYGL